MKKRWIICSFIMVIAVLTVIGVKYVQQKNRQSKEVNSGLAFPKEEETIAKKEGDMAVVNNPNSILVLVNKKRSLPDGYKPKDLVVPNVRFSYKGYDEKKQMRKEAAAALEEMFQQAEKERIYLFAVSGFRSFHRQKALHTMYTHQDGEVKTTMSSAVPGTSEHQTGLAIDVTSQSAKFQLEDSFGDTKEGKWLADNAHKFGFVVRYEKEKKHVTGYTYEPWHVRYVGNPHATYLYENQLTLEEVVK